MCNGTILSNGERCMYEISSGGLNGDCSKLKSIHCPADAEYCRVCECFYDDEEPCMCGGE